MNKNRNFYLNNPLTCIYVPIFLIALSLFFLFWNLDGDPSILKYYGDYADEGYWLQNPASKIVYGKYLTDDQSVTFFGAPLYNQILTFQFHIFGISFFSARVVSIILLFLTAVVLYYIFIPTIKHKNYIFLYIAGFLLLFDNKLYYQWGTPIPMEIFFQSVVILYLIKYKLDNYHAAIRIVILMYLSILSKTTSIWLIALVLILFWLDNRIKCNRLLTSKPIFRFLLFLIIAIAPFLLLNYYFAQINSEVIMPVALLISISEHNSIRILRPNVLQSKAGV